MNDPAVAPLFFLGLLGTGHCIGMCGPLVLVIPASTGRFSSHLLYHAGRITSYVLLGCLLGGIGAGIRGLSKHAGTQEPGLQVLEIQVIFSLIAAVFLLLFGLMRLGVLREPGWLETISPAGLPGFQGIRKRLLEGGGPLTMWLMGLMMGFLPCGLSYAAFARVLATADVMKSAVSLMAFGLGTLPGLLLVGTAGSQFFLRWRKQTEIVAGVLMLLMGYSLAADVLVGK